ncbi:MAG TPA: hypothetical protein VIM90_10810 [Arenimonas sp.]
MSRHIRNQGAYNRAVERGKRSWPGNATPAAGQEGQEVSIAWLVITLEHLAEEDFLADREPYRKALTEAVKLVRQHAPGNHAELAKLALGDVAVKAIIERAGLNTSRPDAIDKVRRLLMAAGAAE